jgi:hypothetical protein
VIDRDAVVFVVGPHATMYTVPVGWLRIMYTPGTGIMVVLS